MSDAAEQARLNEHKTENQKDLADHQAETKMRQQAHQQNLSVAQQQLESEKAVYLEKLMETNMSDAGIKLLDNMVDQSFILGNITEAEYHDIKWQMHAMYVKIKSNFPPQESAVTGDVRAFVLDDYDEGLEPLTGQQRTIIVQMIRGVMMLVSRSKGGFQQEMNVKSISVSEVMNPDDGEEDGLKLGLFGG